MVLFFAKRKMKFEFTDENEFWQQAKDDVVFSVKQALADYGECRLGLSGGSTPKKLYEMLTEESLPWDKIKLITIDERYVPSDDRESNLGMIRRTLTSKIMLPPDNLIHFDASLPWESAAKEMTRRLKALATIRKPIFDLLILGMGTDGHIASLFPGDAACDSSQLASTATAQNQKTPQRLTLCMPALTSANAALLLLKGPEKAGLPEAADQTPFTELSTQVHTKILFCAS
jgi:6-phosphogluconolactonase